MRLGYLAFDRLEMHFMAKENAIGISCPTRRPRSKIRERMAKSVKILTGTDVAERIIMRKSASV